MGGLYLYSYTYLPYTRVLYKYGYYGYHCIRGLDLHYAKTDRYAISDSLEWMCHPTFF